MSPSSCCGQSPVPGAASLSVVYFLSLGTARSLRAPRELSQTGYAQATLGEEDCPAVDFGGGLGVGGDSVRELQHNRDATGRPGGLRGRAMGNPILRYIEYIIVYARNIRKYTSIYIKGFSSQWMMV